MMSMRRMLCTFYLSRSFLYFPTRDPYSRTRLCVPNFAPHAYLKITITGKADDQCAIHPPTQHLTPHIHHMAPLQFQPLASQPTPTFWSALNTLKLDRLKLDDTQQPISGWLEEGREVIDKENGDRRVGVDGSIGVGGSSFGEGSERSAEIRRTQSSQELIYRAPSGSKPINGIFKNFNTIEEFKAIDPKKDLFNQLTDSVSILRPQMG